MTTQNQDTQQVTAIISHLVRPGREQGYEEWIAGISAAAKTFEGHQGVNIIRPRDRARPEYVAILRFDGYDHLKQWLESATRRTWLERLQPLIQKPEDIQTLTGLEMWFTLPESPLKTPPPRYKMVLVTWLGVFFTLAIVSRLLAPLLLTLPLLLSQLITTGLVVNLLTYFVMPNLTRLFHGWLHPQR
ncbi:MAG: antibiotic biosynthesis monooxygenase [Cyanobacteria bacterium J06626_18]